MDLQCLIDDALRRFRSVEFGHGRFPFGVIVRTIVRPGGLVDEQTRGFELRRHLRELELDTLKLSDRPAELPAGFTVLNRFVQSSLREADRGGADAAPQEIESRKGDFQSFALFAEQRVFTHDAVGKFDHADRMRREHLSFFFDEQSRRIGRKQKSADAFGFFFRRGGGENDVVVGDARVRDEPLRARQAEFISVALRASLQGRHVRSSVRLGNSEGCNTFASCDRW